MFCFLKPNERTMACKETQRTRMEFDRETNNEDRGSRKEAHRNEQPLAPNRTPAFVDVSRELLSKVLMFLTITFYV